MRRVRRVHVTGFCVETTAVVDTREANMPQPSWSGNKTACFGFSIGELPVVHGDQSVRDHKTATNTEYEYETENAYERQKNTMTAV